MQTRSEVTLAESAAPVPVPVWSEANEMTTPEISMRHYDGRERAPGLTRPRKKSEGLK
jgi:hypothetical protein